MSTIETQTPSHPHEETFDQQIDEDLIMVNTASRNIVEMPIESSADEREDISRARRIAIGAATGAALLVGASTGITGLVSASDSSVEYSEETTEHVVTDGEGTLSIVDTIPGSEANRIAVANHIESANADVYENGLQAGERVSIPVSINGAEPKE